MKKVKLVFSLCLVIYFLAGKSTIAQSTEEEEEQVGPELKSKRFHIGLYVGSYFANNETADVYDGYGYDLGGAPNNFLNSFMYTKIINQYGGFFGQPDYIAEALGVQHGEWTFNESDMPVNMRYNVAFLVGINGRIKVSEMGSILLHANASKLSISGNFTISTIPQLNANQLQKSVRTFAIKGGEQRILFQAGYQHMTGEASQKINFLVEGGLNVTLAKFDDNVIQINNLLIDITTYFDPLQPNATATARRPGGVGFGAFGGAGLNFNVNSKTQVQLLYTPTLEQVKVELNPSYKLQNALGLRLYYSL
jgi:hypothetical protein